MITASEGNWNSATTLYIARRLEEIAQGRRIAVLDMGCGDGTVLEHLVDYGYELYGYDFRWRKDALRENLGRHFGDEFDDRIRMTESERRIPFEDDSFDVVYANQVFEHVKFFDCMVGECARVLKPGGILLATFPLATYPIELHLRIPFAHWLPPGPARVAYLKVFYALGLRPKIDGLSARQTAVKMDRFLSTITFYRFLNEVVAVGTDHFHTCEIETRAYIQAKIDLLIASRKLPRRLVGRLIRLCVGPLFSSFVTHFFNAALAAKHPRRKKNQRPASSSSARQEPR